MIITLLPGRRQNIGAAEVLFTDSTPLIREGAKRHTIGVEYSSWDHSYSLRGKGEGIQNKVVFSAILAESESEEIAASWLEADDEGLERAIREGFLQGVSTVASPLARSIFQMVPPRWSQSRNIPQGVQPEFGTLFLCAFLCAS